MWGITYFSYLDGLPLAEIYMTQLVVTISHLNLSLSTAFEHLWLPCRDMVLSIITKEIR